MIKVSSFMVFYHFFYNLMLKVIKKKKESDAFIFWYESKLGYNDSWWKYSVHWR